MKNKHLGNINPSKIGKVGSKIILGKVSKIENFKSLLSLTDNMKFCFDINNKIVLIPASRTVPTPVMKQGTFS